MPHHVSQAPRMALFPADSAPADGTLMHAQAPALEERSDPMDARQRDVGGQ